jgi:hypothetical protein
MNTPRTDALIDSGEITKGTTAAAVRQIETELAEKVAKLRDILGNFSHGQIGDMICICGNSAGAECIASSVEKALQETK